MTVATPIILEPRIFNIDPTTNSYTPVELKGMNTNDLLQFLKTIAADTRKSSSKRAAKFKINSIVKLSLTKILTGTDVDKNANVIAQALLDSEKAYNKKLQNLKKELKKGSLVITRFKTEAQEVLLVCKIDFEKFLEEKTYEQKLGLSVDKAMLKSCLINIDNSKLEDSLLLADSNSSISKFWWDEFLKAEFVRNDSQNTSAAFELFESSLSNIYKHSPEDHTDIRNNLISYFKTTKVFKYEEMVERVITHYDPMSNKVKTKDIEKKFKKVMDEGEFDGTFNIVTKEVRARAKKVYKLDGDIELTAHGSTENIYSATIKNDSYVLVKTVQSTDSFKTLKINEK